MHMGLNPFTNCSLSLLKRTLILLLGMSMPAASLVAQAYCASSATSTADSECDLVQLNTINNNTAGICATYSNFTAISTNLTIGNSYNLTVTAGTCGGAFTKHGKVYIDWNQDFDFLDPGEEVFGFGPIVAAAPSTTSITVPGTASLGSTRMRVIVSETGSLANINSCNTMTWGETEDYTVNITPSAPNDMGATVISSPNSGCSLTAAEQVSISVTNFGTNTQTSWNVGYRVNGGPAVIEPMTGSLASGATLPYTFTATTNLAAPGTYVIESWSTLAGDAFSGNDTVTKIVTGIPGVNTFPYTEDFEAGNGGWLPGGNASSWAYGTPAKTDINSAASGTKAYVTGGLGTTSYNANEDSHVLGPCFDFTTLQNPWISLNIWWHSEFSWDGSNLQYSTDFGTTWNNVGNYLDPGNWYNDNSLNGTPGGSQEGWTGGAFGNLNGSGSYVTAAHRLDGLAGVPSLRFRVTFGSDGSVQSDGVAFDDINISEGPLAALGPDMLLCGGDTIILDAGPFAAYQWSNGPTTRYDTITQLNAGTIWVKVTDTFGFYDFDTISVSLSNPIVNVGIDSTICPGDTVFLDAGSHPNGSFLWNTTEVTQTIAATVAGTYWVDVTDSAGCHKQDSMVLTVAIPPTLDLGNDTTVCSNSPMTLDAGTGPIGTVYQWSTSSNTQVLVITSSGTYSASVTTPGGCAAIDSVTITHFPSPSVNLGPDRTECGAYVLDAGPGGTSYSWSTGPSTQTISSAVSGSYQVTVTNQFGCENSDGVTITVGTIPTVSLGPDLLVCNGQSVTLDAGNPGATYLWSNGQSTQTISVTNPGTYVVDVISPNGCIGRDTIVVEGSPLAVNLGPDNVICENGGVVLNAGNPGMTFSWSTGDTTQTTAVTQPGTYSVTVTNPLGCSAVDNITLTQVAGITAAATAPTTAILFQSVQFNDASTPTPISWDWRFGDGNTSTLQNPTHTYLALGTYTVTLIVNNGDCLDTTEVEIDVNQYVGGEDGYFASEFDLYPNPSSDVFHLYLELYKRSNLAIAVTDLQGKMIYSEEVKSADTYKTDIQMQDFAKGVYILSVQAGEKKIFRKLVLQ